MDELGYSEVAIDFNHNTVPGSPAYKGEPATIADMATPRVVEGEGLVFENVRWTPEGIAHRAHYPDVRSVAGYVTQRSLGTSSFPRRFHQALFLKSLLAYFGGTGMSPSSAFSRAAAAGAGGLLMPHLECLRHY